MNWRERDTIKSEVPLCPRVLLPPPAPGPSTLDMLSLLHILVNSLDFSKASFVEGEFWSYDLNTSL